MHLLFFQDNREARWQILQQPNRTVGNAKNDHQGGGVHWARPLHVLMLSIKRKMANSKPSEGCKGTYLNKLL